MDTNEEITLTPVTKLPLSSLTLYRNPRTDLGDIELLIEQIIASGKVNEPLSGFIKDGVFNVVEGKRRFTALSTMQERGGYDEIINSVPVKLIEDTSDVAISFLQLLSFERKDLTPLELAEEIKRLSEQFAVTTEEISLRLKVSTVYVNQLKRLANVPDNVKDAITKEVVTSTQVRDAMKAGKLDELIALIEGLTTNEENEEETVGEKKIKEKIAGKNSVRDFRRFMKVFSRVFPNKDKQEKFELIEAIVNNELDYDYFVRYFTSEKTKDKAFKTNATDEIKAPKEVTKKAPKAPVKNEKLQQIMDAVENFDKPSKTAKKKPAKVNVPKNGEEAANEPKNAKKGTSRKVGYDKKTEMQAV